MSNLDERLNAIISQGSDTQQIEDEYTMVPTVTEVPITEYEIVPSKNIQEPVTDYDDDYILARTTLRGVLGRATGILDVAIINAINTENPKYVDTVTSLITAVRGVTKDLMDIHGKGSNEKENPKQSIQPTVTINNFAKEKDEILTVLETLPDKKDDDVVDVEVTKS
jgi:hypothetical protein